MKRGRTAPPLIKHEIAFGIKRYIDDNYIDQKNFGLSLPNKLSESAVNRLITRHDIVVRERVYSYRQNLFGSQTRTQGPLIIQAEATGLDVYIKENYDSLINFCNSLPHPVAELNVQNMIRKRYIVVNKRLYSYRFNIKTVLLLKMQI